ncbi:MAG: hypothetical protein V4437_03230, partial [Patescibacteria group bacterium]
SDATARQTWTTALASAKVITNATARAVAITAAGNTYKAAIAHNGVVYKASLDTAEAAYKTSVKACPAK